MCYTVFSLNGAWEMHYQESKYLGTVNPFNYIYKKEDAAGTEPEDRSNDIIENAVPAYWEDMTTTFQKTSFFGKLRINPEYGIQKYPIIGNAPDMALPNIIGNFFYRRNFLWENMGKPTMLHLEGVQNAVSVWVNDIFLGRHEGYSAPFDMEIPSEILKIGENEIVLSVSNHRLEGYGGEIISGLTSRAANECTGGITGNVELRVYHTPLRDVTVTISEDCKKAAVRMETVGCFNALWAVYDGPTMLKNGECSGEFDFGTEALEYWSPENPKLYTLKIQCPEGEISRIFGVRRLSADGTHLRLNNIPYFLRGICEHCYFPETIHPDHDSTYYRKIIRTVKNLGFNFIRFHTYIPEEEYMQAADELGILLHVECPNNTTIAEWEQIVKFCRRHPSVVIYCCGNELLMDEPFIEYLHKCADIVHENTDALFSPMSALRGLEYFWVEPEQEPEIKMEPFKHHPRRFREVGAFSDMYSSYANGHHSYFSLNADAEEIDRWSAVYGKPRVSHEICIDGTYTDLSLKSRYKGTRVGNTEMFTSLEQHLEEKGLLKNAALYFRNSCEWQRRMRKYCFEAVRKSDEIAGYDFLGPIDTHWHTFGYDVGMMNEFYELKPGESVRNIRMYNGATVLLNDIGKNVNYASGEEFSCGVLISHYGENDLQDAELVVRLIIDGKIEKRESLNIKNVKNGKVTKLYNFSSTLPNVTKPCAMKLYVTLETRELFAENEWELYLFPDVLEIEPKDILITKDIDVDELTELMKENRKVLLLGAKPFQSIPTTFRIGLAGRTSGNLATVVSDHPVFNDFPNDGFCGWQFAQLLENASAVCFEADEIPFDPIIEVVSTHKYVIRQSAMFEFNVDGAGLFVCSLDFKEKDPAAKWLLKQIISYMQSDLFQPKNEIDDTGLYKLASSKVIRATGNTNVAFNMNDKTAVRKKRF